MEQTRSAQAERDILTSIYLDYGADVQECRLADLNISERGMKFKSRWQFSIGTQLELRFCFQNLRGRKVKVEVEGIVVGSEAAPGEGWDHLLIFPEIPPALKAHLRNLREERRTSRQLSLN